jgi:rare lipoprotein A
MRRVALIFMAATIAAASAGCHSRTRGTASSSPPGIHPAGSPEIVVAAGPSTVVLAPDSGSIAEGNASYYGDPYHGRRTANGETFDKNKLTAAHRTLPFDTWVRVENLTNGMSVDVRINDRGPFVGGRVIDLSEGAARRIDMIRAGIAPVRLIVVQESPNPATARPEQEVFYAVQIGAFRDERAAQNLRRELESRYTGIYVDRPTEDSPFYKVRIGRALLAEARYLQSLIRAEHDLDAIVVEMNAD